MPGEFSVVVMDAGQGESLLVVFPDDSLIMIDCGCMKNTGIVKEPIKAVLNRYLPNAGGRLKALVLTHPDADHINLVNEVIIKNKIHIGYLVYGGNADKYSGIAGWIKKHKYKTAYPSQIDEVADIGPSHYSEKVITELSYGGSEEYEKVDVRILAANVGESANAKSVVLLITYGDINVFLMGDAPFETENFIIENMSNTLLGGRHTLLKVGHHGSNNSSGEEWIKKIQPEIAFISSDTKTFSGSSIPCSTAVDRIITKGSLLSDSKIEHCYVQYNVGSKRHEQIKTLTKLYTTIHLLEFRANNTDFTSYGTTWYYSVKNKKDGKQVVDVYPSCGWENVLTPY